MKNLRQVQNQARQGDVFIIRHEGQTKEGKEISREDGAVVLAHGEVTGHAHRISDPGVCFLRAEGAAYDLLKVTEEGCTLKHQLPGGGQADHDPIPIGGGTFEVRIQSEWDYLGEMGKQVQD